MLAARSLLVLVVASALGTAACGSAGTRSSAGTVPPDGGGSSPATTVPGTVAPPVVDSPPSTAPEDPDVVDTTTAITTAITIGMQELPVPSCDDVPVMAPSVVGTGAFVAGIDPIFQAVLATYAHEHADTYAGMWIDREANGTVVLAFTDDPAEHRAALAQRRPSPDDIDVVQPMPPIVDDRPIGEWGVAFDVVRAPFTEAALIDHANAASAALQDAGSAFTGLSVDVTRGRVGISTARSPATVDDVAELVAAIDGAAPLEVLCIEGPIVDARPDPVAPGTPLAVIALPGPDGTYPPSTEVECAGTRFTLGDLESLTPVEEADPGLQAVVDGWITTGGVGLPADGWVVLTEAAGTATLVRIADDAMAVVGAERGANGWRWAGASGGGPCEVRLRLPDGLGAVDWQLDPAFAAPGTAATEVHVLVTERGCASGEPMGERLLGPEVVGSDDAVRLAFAAIPVVGGATCPSNPSTAVTIQLDAPLGDRALVDGLVIGPLEELLPA